MTVALPSLWHRLRHTRLRDVVRGRVDGSLDWRFVVAGADLPDPAADAVVNLVLATRLWNSEKRAIAQELVAHFQDGLEAGRSAVQLVNDFGDVRQAAKLMRRAKRRNRPLWWQAQRFAGYSLVAYLLLAIYMFVERPALDTDYLAIINRRVAAQSQELPAWPRYSEAMLALGWRNNKPPQSLNGVDFSADLSDETTLAPALRKFLAEHQKELAQLREAAKLPLLGYTVGVHYHPEDRELLGDWESETKPDGEPPELYSVLLGHVQVLGNASKLLSIDALLAIEGGEAPRVVKDLTACLQVARHVRKSPWLISGFFSFRIERQALDVLNILLSDYSELLSEEELIGIAHAISAIRPPMNFWFESERLSGLDVLQRIHGKSGRVTYEGTLYLGRLGSMAFAYNNQEDKRAQRAQQVLLGVGLPAVNLIIASRSEMVTTHNQFWQDALSELSRPLWMLSSEEDWLDSHIGTSRWDRIRYMPLMFYLPAVRNARFNLDRSTGLREGALVGIALELYRREHGDWPESLEELSPQFLPVIPVDRITGHPLHYHLVDGQPVVYSIGVDLDDDQSRSPRVNGKPTPLNAAPNDVLTVNRHLRTNLHYDGDWVIWSTAKTNAEVGLRNNFFPDIDR